MTQPTKVALGLTARKIPHRLDIMRRDASD